MKTSTTFLSLALLGTVIALARQPRVKTPEDEFVTAMLKIVPASMALGEVNGAQIGWRCRDAGVSYSNTMDAMSRLTNGESAWFSNWAARNLPQAN